MDARFTYELKTALFDVQRYLLDQIPPLTAADAITTLMAQPPELLMQQIQSWAAEQAQRQDVSYADLLFHALRKVYLTSVLHLVDEPALNDYLDVVTPLALKACPPDEKDILRRNLIHLRDTINVDASGIVPIAKTSRARKEENKPAPAVVPLSGPARRLSMVLDRLAAFPALAASLKAGPAAPSHLISMATSNAKSEDELNAYL